MKDRPITVIGTYKTSKTKIEFSCDKCGNEWVARPQHVIDGGGCSNCHNISITKTHQEFIKELGDTNIIILGTYKNGNKIRALPLSNREGSVSLRITS